MDGNKLREIENMVFRGCMFVDSKLLAFGFHKEGGAFIYSAPLLSGAFKANVKVESGKLSGQVIDADLGEEYHLLRTELSGFPARVRSAYEDFLSNIREHCCLILPYSFPQANMADAFIADRFGIKAEFLWDKFPKYGVYRNMKTRKRFAIIMDIEYSKIGERKEGKLAMMDIKLKPSESLFAIGAVKAYHLSAKSWIGVPLDGRMSDDEVKRLITLCVNDQPI